MKAKRNLVIGLVLGGIMGWTLGFLRLPYLENNYAFGIGFISCLAIVLIGMALIFVWNKNQQFVQLMGKNQATTEGQTPQRTYTLLWILVSSFILVGGLISSGLIYQQNALVERQLQTQNEQIIQQSALMEANRRSNSLVLANNLYEQLNEALENSPNKVLSEEMLKRIAALNYTFQPYSYLQGDSLSGKKLSPERGQLLVVLASLNLDSSSFKTIKRNISFANADLSNANLNELDLSGIDLRAANFQNAQLQSTNLEKANLNGASFVECDLTKAHLNKAKLESTNFSYAILQGADLSETNLNGATLKAAKMNQANLSKAVMTFANLTGAFLNEANLSEIDASRSTLREANLTKAILTKANMRVTNFSGTILKNANLEGANLAWAIVDGVNWLERLEGYQAKGGEKIVKGFKVKVDKKGPYGFLLEPKQ